MPAIFAATALLPEGWRDAVRLTVGADGRITAVACGVAAEAGDERCAVLVPAVANLHSHAFQRGMAGLAEERGPEADSFWTWRNWMYRFAARMSPDDVQAVAAQLFVEMLEAGYGRVGEFHYLHHAPDGRPYAERAAMASAIVAAAAETGIGLTLLPVFYAHGGFGGLPPGDGQKRFLHDPEGFARLIEDCGLLLRDLPGSVLGVAPHSLRAVTPEELRAVTALLPGGPVHLHVAEQVKEVEDCLAWSGGRPVDWLLDHAPVDRRWCLIHATHLTPAETTRLASSGAVVGSCPLTEANLGDGIFPAEAYLAEGGRIGIGSDSHIRISVAGELEMLEYGQRLRHRARNVLARGPGSTGRALFDAVASGGAQALGVPADGRIAAGASADLVALAADHPALLARRGDALLDGWIFAGGNPVVERVWVRGRATVVAGAHPRRAVIGERFAATMKKLVN